MWKTAVAVIFIIFDVLRYKSLISLKETFDIGIDLSVHIMSNAVLWLWQREKNSIGSNEVYNNMLWFGTVRAACCGLDELNL